MFYIFTLKNTLDHKVVLVSHPHIHAGTREGTHACINTCTHTCAHIHAHTHLQAQVHLNSYTHTRTSTPKLTHTHRETHTYTHMHANTHTQNKPTLLCINEKAHVCGGQQSKQDVSHITRSKNMFLSFSVFNFHSFTFPHNY